MSCGKSPPCDGGDGQPWERVVGFSAGSTSSASSANSVVVSPSNKPSNVTLSLLEGIRMMSSSQESERMREMEPECHGMDECDNDVGHVRNDESNDRSSLLRHPDVSFSGWARPPAPDECQNSPVCIDLVDDKKGKTPARSTAVEIPALRSRVVAEAERPRVIRRVPEPPAAPAAITAPAVVQMLLASQATAAAEQARLEQNAMCRRNNLKQAYAAQEKLLSYQAKAERLEAELSGDSQLQHRRVPGRHRTYTGAAQEAGRCEWQEWYQRPQCRAVADFCSGLEDTVRSTAWKSAPQPPLDC